MRFATDTGGTFTDLLVEDDAGRVHMFKAPTVPSEPVKGVLDAFDLAARQIQVDRRTLLSRGHMFIHGTTHAINAIITRKTAKTALLVTQGHPDVLVLREGGRVEPFNHAVPYPDPYIPRWLTFEVPERILASGEIRRPLDPGAVAAIADRLHQQGAEAVAVCLLWSVLHPQHELQVGEILAAGLPGIPVTLSHLLNPALREYRRAIAAALDASLKPLMNKYLAGLTDSMRAAGFDGRILVLTSQGGMVDVEEVRQAPILAINSGPSMAPIAGGRLAAAAARADDAIVFDTGGTTFDVSLVRNGRVPFTHETWLGRPFQSDLTGFPSVDVRSIGAGGGSIAWVEEGKVLHVGPQSAGAVPGPACYAAGGRHATVTDTALVLGHIDPSFFLGGRIRLDRNAAMAAVQREVAAPLAMTLEAAASAVMAVWSENMVQAISDITVNQGIDPANAIIIGGGGAAGLNALTIAQRLGCKRLVIPEVGAALSAFGAVVSDIAREYRRVFVTGSTQFDRDGAAAVIAELRRRAKTFANAAGAAAHDTRFDFLVEARYLHQVWEIDVAIDPDRLLSSGGVDILLQDFHRAHDEIFAFSDPQSPIEVIAWRAAVRCAAAARAEPRLAHTPTTARLEKYRRAFFPRDGWIEVPVLAFGGIEPGARTTGPAIIESPFTSIVIDPSAAFSRSASGDLIVEPRGAQSVADEAHASVRGRT